MSDDVTHPTPDELAAFGLGKLGGAAATTVANHLAAYETCHNAVAKLSADAFEARIRAAKLSLVGPAPSDRSRLLPETLPSASPPLVTNVPPELAAHPKYRILAELGHGKMGVVHHAEHRIMGRLSAIVVTIDNCAFNASYHHNRSGKPVRWINEANNSF